VIGNAGIPLEQHVWLMVSVYVVVALTIAIAAGPRFAHKPTAPIVTRPGRSPSLLIETAPALWSGSNIVWLRTPQSVWPYAPLVDRQTQPVQKLVVAL